MIDKVPDLANLAAGGLVFGEFLSDSPFSMSIAVLGILLWDVLHRMRDRTSSWWRKVMTGALVMLGGIALVVGIITAWDLWTRRQDRRRAQKNQP